MTDKALPHPAVAIKDTQSMEHIQWEDCLFLLKVGSGEIQFALYKQETRYFVRLFSYSFQTPLKEADLEKAVEEILTENKIAVSRCKETRIVFDTPLFTAIPDALYKEELQESYFSFLYEKEEDQQLQTDKISSREMRLVYAVDKAFFTYARRKFPHLSVFHSETVLLHQLRDLPDDAQWLYISLHAATTCLTVFSEGKLLLMQAYHTQTDTDVVYRVLSAIRQLELPVEKVQLYLTGARAEATVVFQKLHAQFDHTEWLLRPEGFQYPVSMVKYPGHYFYHLVSLALCGS